MKCVKLYGLGLFFLFDRFTRYLPSHFLRELIYRFIYKITLGQGAVIYSGVEMRSPWKINIGRNSIIGNGCMLDGRRGLRIGDNVNISSGAWIWTLQHDVNAPDFAAVGAGVSIGDRAWICSRVIILPGVEIGEGAVVAAGSVVTKNLPPYSIAGGIPAKVIGARNRDLTYSLDFKVPFI